MFTQRLFQLFFFLLRCLSVPFASLLGFLSFHLCKRHLSFKVHIGGIFHCGGVAMLAKIDLDCEMLPDYCKVTRGNEVLTLLHNRAVCSAYYWPLEGNL